MRKLKLCPGAGCPLKENCERFQPEVKLTKDDFFGTPFNNFTDKCKYFITKTKN